MKQNDALQKNYGNVFWFLIDGLRPDFLHIAPGESPVNFFDTFCSRGAVFNRVATAGGGTYTSMHSIFTSLLPSFNGVTGASKEELRNFNQEIFTIADYFQLLGYETFRYDDADLGRDVPMEGFKRWEGSGYKVGRILNNTDNTKNKRRDRFIEDVNNYKGNKFVYHHALILHESNGAMGTYWTSEAYENNVNIAAEEFKRIYAEYDITENDLVIASSDHGVLLDVDYVLCPAKGYQYEQSIWAFMALIGKNIKPAVLEKPISALDEMPTILRIAFGEKILSMLPIQGRDQYPYIYEGKYEGGLFFRETTSICVTSGEWKYVYDPQNPSDDWLINTRTNADYEVNLKEQYPEMAERYRGEIKKMRENADSFKYRAKIGISKKDMPKKFSLVVQIGDPDVETVESLLDMSGPYYEVLMPETDITIKYKDNYKARYIDVNDGDAILSECKGEWIVYISDEGEWAEYFLSDLYRYILCHRDRGVAIIGKHYKAARKDEIGNFAGIACYEKEEVRDIRFVHKERGNKKYILFGCGEIGREAVDYFGRTNIECFVDNNEEMAGQEVCGIGVISFDKFKRIYCGCEVMITLNERNARQVAEQLERNGIREFQWFREYQIHSRQCWDSGYDIVPGSEMANS